MKTALFKDNNKFAETVDNLEEKLIETLGKDEFIMALTKALSYSEKMDLYESIAKDWDIEQEVNGNGRNSIHGTGMV